MVDTPRLEFIGGGQIRYYSLARYALMDALRIVGVKPGSRILLPAYLCRDLLAPLHILGCHALWYQVAPDMTPADPPDIWPLSDVVLAINYFGFPQNLKPFEVYAARTGALVIEDNAHGYLSQDLTGRWLGCRTGLGIFSFRKTLRIPDGGALLVGEKYSLQKLPEETAQFGRGLNRAQLIKAQLRILPVVGEFAYRGSIALARAMRKLRTGNTTPMSDPESEQLIPAEGRPWIGLLPALQTLNNEYEIQRRRRAYLECAKLGLKVGAVPVFSSLPLNCAPYGYPFRGELSTRVALRKYADVQGFDFVPWPDLPSTVEPNAPKHYQDVFLVNFLW